MPRDSQFTEPILSFMQREGRPVTTTEIQEGAGMSRQAAYQWLESNAWRVREVGQGRHNAKAYVLADSESATVPGFRPRGANAVRGRARRNAPAGSGTVVGAGVMSAGAVDRDLLTYLGRMFTVVGLRLIDNTVVVETVTDDGTELLFLPYTHEDTDEAEQPDT